MASTLVFWSPSPLRGGDRGGGAARTGFQVAKTPMGFLFLSDRSVLETLCGAGAYLTQHF